MAKTIHKTRYRKLLLSNLANIFGFALFMPLYGVYVTKLGQSPETGSFVWGIHTLLTGLLVLFVGRVEDKLHRGYFKALVAGNMMQVIGSAVFLLQSDFTYFIVGLMIYSVGTAILAPSWFSLFSGSIASKHSAKGWSISQGGGALAGSLGAGLGGYLYAIGEFRLVFMVLVGMHVVGTIFAVTTLRDS